MTGADGWVDVIIPTYNRSALCHAAVQSVLAQTYPCVRVLVVDDGSEDDTEAVLRGLDPRVQYVRQPNAGVAAARNRGLALAHGEFIAFLDSDDEWLPWKLEAQIAVLRAFPQAGMVWTDMIAIDADGRPLDPAYLQRMYSAYRHFDRDRHFAASRPLRECWPGCPEPLAQRRCYVGDIFPWMFLGNLVHTSSVLLRRQRQLQVGLFNTQLQQSGEDYEFHLRTCRAGPVAYIDASSIRYRVGAPDQLTAPQHMVWMACNNLQTVQAAFKAHRAALTLPEALIRARLAESHRWLGRTLLDSDPAQARPHFRQSLAWSGFRATTAALYLLSFLPAGLIRLLRRLRQALRSS